MNSNIATEYNELYYDNYRGNVQINEQLKASAEQFLKSLAAMDFEDVTKK